MAKASAQTEIFNLSEHTNQFAELCNALYAEQLRQLSEVTDTADVSVLRRRLASLSGHVQRTAHALLLASEQLARSQTPVAIKLDIHSASWLAKPASKAPLASASSASAGLAPWLEKHACLALVMPVLVEQQGISRVYLDSIDEIQLQEGRVHLNQWGWFAVQGSAVNRDSVPAATCAHLLQPNKVNITAACCGHQWGPSGRLQPANLNLRALLLTSTLVWPKFTEVRKLPF